nr:MAG TPA: hypothetical protein [Caudoviricetes sp.]
MWSSVGQSGDVFFRLDLCFYIQAPEVNQLWQDFVNAERVELFQPFIRRSRNGWVSVFCHDVGDVLKHFKAFNIQCGGFLCIFSHRLLQCCKILINISAKFQTIQSGDCRTCLKRHINPINGDVLLNCHTAPSLRFHRCYGCFTTLYSGSQIWHIYRLVPILINLGIRFLTGFSFYQTTVQRRCGQRQRFCFNFLFVLNGAGFCCRTRGGTAEQTVPNFILIAAEFKQQGKLRYFCSIGFRENALFIQFLTENVCRKLKRNQCDFKISSVTGVIVDHIVHTIVSVKIGCFTFCIDRQRHCTGNANWLCKSRYTFFIIRSDFCIVNFVQTELYLVFLHCHIDQTSIS